MARPQLKISVPQPCSENWREMTPQAAGRFCASCATTVVDFCKFSDKQLLEYFTRQSGKTCGRFSATQLNRAVYAEALPKQIFFPRALAAVALFLGISSQTQGQNIPDQPVPSSFIETDKNAAAEKTVVKIPEKVSSGGLVISGKVFDKQTNTGLPGVIVHIKNTKTGTSTDAYGNYKFTIPDSLQSEKNVIVTRYIGYKDEVYEIERGNLPEELNFLLEYSATVLSGEVIITEIKKTPGNYLRSIWWKTKSLFTDEY